MINKKAQTMNTIVAVFATIVIFTIIVVMGYKHQAENTKGEDMPVGSYANALINAYQQEEEAMLYLDVAAKQALSSALIRLGESGGIYESECGESIYNLWNNETKNCVLNIENNFKKTFESELQQKLLLSPIPLYGKYDFTLNQKGRNLEVIGLTDEKATITISTKDQEVVVVDVSKTVMLTPEQIEKINAWTNTIESASKQTGVESSFIKGIISQESKGDILAVSPTGCAGIMQFCHGTASDYVKKGFLVGQLYELAKECTPSSSAEAQRISTRNFVCEGNDKGKDDARFQAQNAIRAGAEYLKDIGNMTIIKDLTTAKLKAIAAGYNGGPGLIQAAIKATGKTDPSWPEISAQITPALLKEKGYGDTDYWNDKTRTQKVKEIRSYVENVMRYYSLWGGYCQTPVKSKPSITLDELKEELKKKDSPALDYAKVFMEEGDKTGIDPVFALAFFQHESNMGTKGVAARTHSIGNIRPKSTCNSVSSCEIVTGGIKQCAASCSDNACNFVDCDRNIDSTDMAAIKSGCFCGYVDWDEGIKAWFKTINDVYVAQGRITIEEIIPKYAPSTENNVQEYISFVKNFARKYDKNICEVSEYIEEPMGTYSFGQNFRTSAIYDLSIYGELKDFSEEVINNCKDDVENCLKDKINTYNNKGIRNIVFLHECEDKEANVFYNLAENFDDCSYAWGQNCKCQITENYTESEVKKVEGKYKFDLKEVEEEDENTPIISLNEEFQTFILEDEKNDLSMEFKLRISVDDPEKIEIEYEYEKKKFDENDKIKDSVINFKDTELRSTPQIDNFETLYIANKDDDWKWYAELEKIEEDEDTIMPGIGNERIDNVCPIAKQTYRLCVSTLRSFPTIKDDVGIVYEDSIIKFGLTLIDNKAPPAVTGLEAKRVLITDDFKASLSNIFKKLIEMRTGLNLQDETTIMLTWKHAEVEDLGLYRVYVTGADGVHTSETAVGDFYKNQIYDESNDEYKAFVHGLSENVQYEIKVAAMDNFKNSGNATVTLPAEQ
ncbi:MAG: transglycosylase SLT domain-containing protein [archaeon]